MIKGSCPRCGVPDQSYLVDEDSGPEIHCLRCGFVTYLEYTVTKTKPVTKVDSLKGGNKDGTN